ncbi:MAG: glycoside hydrolase family 15 protein [Motilibacteraceae bacterium]
MPGRIEDYAVVGDMHSVALVCRDGSVDWLCLPRFDSPAFFAGLLGGDRNGHWRVAPMSGGPASRRRYRGNTLVLESEWDTADGTVRVVDFMPPRDGQPNLVRIVEGVSGRVRMKSELRLRFDYGHILPWVRRVGEDLHAVAGPDAVWLHGDVRHHGQDDMSSGAEFEVGPGDRVSFVLTWAPSHEQQPDPTDALAQLDLTERFWAYWMTDCRYEGDYEEAVCRSLITLKALTYEPTGGIVAAATTSLPEDIGGVRNWDYRFCWLRDATLTLQALLHSGYTQEASDWREWLLRAVAGDPADLQIMYSISGERRLTETELDWLPGYEGSSPVRIGNQAAEQLQLDVYGELMGALALARARGLDSDQNSWNVQKAIMDWLEGNWSQPDEGLWEIRGDRREFVHSKVLVWSAFDAAVRAVEKSGLDGPVDRWKQCRDDVHQQVMAKGFDADANTFVQYYGASEVDASLLLMPQVGFIDPKDDRFVGTVDAIGKRLRQDGGLLMRYENHGDVDGLPGKEGAFLVCTFWYADALHAIGRQDEARKVFEHLLSLRNDVGLLAEEYDVRYSRQVGNFPQAFSHVGLVNTAHNLANGDLATPKA